MGSDWQTVFTGHDRIYDIIDLDAGMKTRCFTAHTSRRYLSLQDGYVLDYWYLPMTTFWAIEPNPGLPDGIVGYDPDERYNDYPDDLEYLAEVGMCTLMDVPCRLMRRHLDGSVARYDYW